MDVGAGRSPTVRQEDRPVGTYYAGLDISAAELRKAPEGSYDLLVAADLADNIRTLVGRFDLIVAWHVLEHVRRLEAAFAHMHSYLTPGGRLIAAFPGTFAAFALVNRALPDRVGRLIMQRLLGKPPEHTFPAYYDHCWYSALERILEPWDWREIVPYFTGASYFRFSPHLQAVYVGYEEWTYLHNHRNLAAHYFLTAVS